MSIATLAIGPVALPVPSAWEKDMPVASIAEVRVISFAKPATDGAGTTATGAPETARWIAGNAEQAERPPTANPVKAVKAPGPKDVRSVQAVEGMHVKPAGAQENYHVRIAKAEGWEPVPPATGRGPYVASAAMGTDSISKGKLPDLQAGKKINLRNILLPLAYRHQGRQTIKECLARFFSLFQV